MRHHAASISPLMREPPQGIGAQVDLVALRVAPHQDAAARADRDGVERGGLPQEREHAALGQHRREVDHRFGAVALHQLDAAFRQRLRASDGPQHHPSILPGFRPARHRTQHNASAPWCRRAHVRTLRATAGGI